LSRTQGGVAEHAGDCAELDHSKSKAKQRFVAQLKAPATGSHSCASRSVAMLEQPRLSCGSLARLASPIASAPRRAPAAAAPDTALTAAPPPPPHNPPRPAPPTQTMGKAKALPSSQGSSQGKKVSSTGSSQTGGKRKKLSHSIAAVLKRQGVSNYHIYIHKVLKQVHPTCGISKQSMSIMNVSPHRPLEFSCRVWPYRPHPSFTPCSPCPGRAWLMTCSSAS
jgi:hypothetical protein